MGRGRGAYRIPGREGAYRIPGGEGGGGGTNRIPRL